MDSPAQSQHTAMDEQNAMPATDRAVASLRTKLETQDGFTHEELTSDVVDKIRCQLNDDWLVVKQTIPPFV